VPLAAAPAHAGGTCFATHTDAPVHAGATPWTEIVGYLVPGIPVSGTRQGADERRRVSHTDNGAQPGSVRAADLRGGGG
jgi:hypothetical protein